eukprot:2338194-Alexandrium_andersonii.AAC.1
MRLTKKTARRPPTPRTCPDARPRPRSKDRLPRRRSAFNALLLAGFLREGGRDWSQRRFFHSECRFRAQRRG